MKIKNMFQRDINRSINGVIQVMQDEEGIVKDELQEYIITRELRRHFTTFFNNYAQALEQATNDVGVWISGFYGSGKSHFLKMLSYLLSNKTIADKPTIEYFKDKLDAYEYATVVRCASVPTQSILFNIDFESSMIKDKTAVLRVFAKVFYDHLGFYGSDLKIAKLEHFIEKQKKTELFRQTFEEVNGAPWLETRSVYAFFEDDIVEVLQRVLGLSETAARNWFNIDDDAAMSIAQLVDEIKDYVDSQGKDFRLVFCVDEVGQYIGTESDLMINLQSIVEGLGSKCRGQVWVIVTSQETIDSVVKVIGGDFSKIQDRFRTKLSLTSSSADEVIKKRILEKNKEADQLLRLVYDKNQAILKNLFTFNKAVSDIQGYADGAEFSKTYPFVPYQFIVLQKVFAEIRQRGSSGAHFSGGERSMLSAFQEAAQGLQDEDENALVPFYVFYDTLKTFLLSHIRRVIDRCQRAADRHEGIERQDVNILKLLYFMRYMGDDVETDIDSIAILMIDNIGIDKINLRQAIGASLTRLVQQNYVARQGDNYFFLTDEEQEIARGIRETAVDGSAIVQSIGRTIFNEIYPSKRFKYGQYNFAYDQYIDDTLVGSAGGGIRLHFLTVASDYYKASAMELMRASRSSNEAIIVLSSQVQYFQELEEAAKIRKYIKDKNVSRLPDSIRDIITKQVKQARTLEDDAKKQIEKAIQGASFYIQGEKADIRVGSVPNMLNEVLEQLVKSVYTGLEDINTYYHSDADILRILTGAPIPLPMGDLGANNGFALHALEQWLEDRHNNHVPVSMGDIQRRYQDIPYGWREQEVAALVARLIVDQKIEVHYGGAVVNRDDRNLVGYLRKKSEVDKLRVSRRIAPSEEQMRKSIAFLRNWLGQMSIPEREEELIAFVKQTFENKLAHYKGLLQEYKGGGHYPEEEAVRAACDLMKEVLNKKANNVALLTELLARQDNLRDTSEDMEEIENFFKTQQRRIFDSAYKLRTSLINESDYFQGKEDSLAQIEEIKAILAMPRPYRRINQLPGLMQNIKAAYNKLLASKRDEVLGIITQCMADVHTLAGANPRVKDQVKESGRRFDQYKERVAEATSLITLDAMVTQVSNYKDQIFKEMEFIIVAPPTGARDCGQPKQNIAQVRRQNVFPVKRLATKEDIDDYLNEVRQKLYQTLKTKDGIQIL